jgi:hypothetical protein
MMTQVDIVRVSGGGVRIGELPGPALPACNRAVLDIAGATLFWPVVDDPGLPSADVHDPALAQQWLWALYGERVAEAVHACATEESDRSRAPAETTALAVSAGRLAYGHWASRWWPASLLDGLPALHPDLLGLELAALTHQCQQLFDADGGQFDDQVSELIESHQAVLDAMVEWWRSASAEDGTEGGTARQLERLLRLLDDAADGAGLDGAALRRLRTALDGGRPPVAAAVPVALTELLARSSTYALAAGDAPATGGRVIARGVGVNDWCRYPPGLVDAAENAVTWTLRAVGALRQLEVEAIAADVSSEPVPGARLAAEVRIDGGATKRIPLGPRHDLWAGAADLELPGPETGARIEVGVLLPGFDPGVDDGAAAEGRAARDAVRALARRRLAAAEGRLLAEIAASDTAEDF